MCVCCFPIVIFVQRHKGIHIKVRMSHVQLHSLQRRVRRANHRFRHSAVVVDLHQYRVSRHAALDLPAKVDLFRFRSVTVALDHFRRPAGPQNQATFATILGATDATPIGTAILSKQIVVDDDQGPAALAVDVLDA